MRATVFLVFLLSLICRSQPASAHTDVTGAGYTSFLHYSQPCATVGIEQDRTLVKSIYLDTKSEYQADDNIEDEEDSSSIAVRKSKIPGREIFHAAYLFILSRAHNRAIIDRPSGSITSHKYITQRVLRI
jgi:hypothetical protein